MAKRKERIGKMRSLRGVEAYTAKDGSVTIYIRYSAQGTPQHEWIGPSEKDTAGRDQTILKARRILSERRAEVREANLLNVRWVSPKEREEQAKQQAVELQDTRRALLFEVASGRFLERCADHYADPKGVRGIFKRLGRAFNGKHLDELTRADVRQFYDDRLANTGPYAGWPNKVGLRVPQFEITKLSALYGFLEEEGFENLRNPCHRPRSRKYAMTKAQVYKPKRKKVIPTLDQAWAIFDAAPTPTYRAAFAVAYYTGGRPESEWCRLTHGDVELPEPGKVKSLRGDGEPILGTVTFRDTKTGDDRTMPLHPDAAEALRAVMLERPDDEGEVEAWKGTPIFRRRNGSAWDRFTYRKGWRKALATATAPPEGEGGDRWPELRRMVIRDFRSTFTTRTREAGTDPALSAKMAGHSEPMSDHYLQVTDAAAKKAVLSLGSYNEHRRCTSGGESDTLSESRKLLQQQTVGA